MSILVDESLPVELADVLIGHDAHTVRDRNWIGLRNGVLLRAAVAAGFQVLITADQNLPHQQNLRGLGVSAIIIAGVRNRIDDVRLLLPQIFDAIATIKPGEWIRVSPVRRDSLYDRADVVAAWP